MGEKFIVLNFIVLNVMVIFFCVNVIVVQFDLMGYIELNEFGVLVIYKSKMDCLWNIIINGYIEFVFICLDIEDKVDIVIVYDGLL